MDTEDATPNTHFPRSKFHAVIQKLAQKYVGIPAFLESSIVCELSPLQLKK